MRSLCPHGLGEAVCAAASCLAGRLRSFGREKRALRMTGFGLRREGRGMMGGFGVGTKHPLRKCVRGPQNGPRKAASTKAKERPEGGVKPPLGGELHPIGNAMRA